MAQAALLNPVGASVRRISKASLLTLNGNEYATATGADAVVTFDLDTARPTVLSQIICGYSAAPAAGATIKVEDGTGNTVFQMPVPATALGPQTFNFDPPLAGTKGNPMIVTLKSGGGAVVGYLFANGYREQ